MNTNKKVLVHCLVGVSRLASLVIAYLLYTKQFSSIQSALDHVIERRNIVYPNEGFFKTVGGI